MFVVLYYHGRLLRSENPKGMVNIDQSVSPILDAHSENSNIWKKRKQPKKDNACFICKQEGHFARKCPKSSSNKLKACIEIQDFVDNCSVIDSQDELLDVYILTDASLFDDESIPDVSQKMNIFYDSESEHELHYSDESSSEDYIEEFSEDSSEDTFSVSTAKLKNSTSVLNSLPP